MKPTEWQEEPTSRWMTSVSRKCAFCGKRTEEMVELKTADGDIVVHACWVSNPLCGRKA